MTSAVRIACIAAATLLFALVAPIARASVIYTATLSGSAENPANASAGTGNAKVTIDATLDTMQVEVTFAGLTGNTTAAHIHCCVSAPSNAGVATSTPYFTGFPLGVTSGTYDHTFDLTDAGSYNPAFVTISGGTVADAKAALLAGLDEGKAYLNVHSTLFAGGEIRGFLQQVPEPATLALLGIGLAGLGISRRRRQ